MPLVLRFSSVAIALTALCVPCVAQQIPAQPGRTPESTTRPGARQAAPQQRTAQKPVVEDQNVDSMIAGMLALANEEEAVIGKFATERAKHEKVQKFASMMAKDHSQMARELLKWAPEATLASGKSANGNNTQSDQTGEQRTFAFNPLDVHRQIANRCIASTEKELGTKKGADFDMCYIGGQCVLHQQMIDKATVLRQYASPELQASIDKGISSAEDHLQQAKQLIDELASAEKDSTR
jgi:predicted outer membrane protein